MIIPPPLRSSLAWLSCTSFDFYSFPVSVLTLLCHGVESFYNVPFIHYSLFILLFLHLPTGFSDFCFRQIRLCPTLKWLCFSRLRPLPSVAEVLCVFLVDLLRLRGAKGFGVDRRDKDKCLYLLTWDVFTCMYICIDIRKSKRYAVSWMLDVFSMPLFSSGFPALSSFPLAFVVLETPTDAMPQAGTRHPDWGWTGTTQSARHLICRPRSLTKVPYLQLPVTVYRHQRSRMTEGGEEMTRQRTD